MTVWASSPDKADSEQAANEERPAVAQGSGSILVMDDEEMVREYAAFAFKNLGCTVMTCVNGKEAISLYKSAKNSGTPYALVIMDLTIPGSMGGVEAARHILDFDPAARLIVSSGYSEDPVMANFKEYGFCAAMEKPYNSKIISELLARVQFGSK